MADAAGAGTRGSPTHARRAGSGDREMGRVAVTFRILPEDSEVDVAGLETSVRGALVGSLRTVAVRPIAFGLKALEATVLVDDAAGAADAVEARIRGLTGVGEVETLGVSLL